MEHAVNSIKKGKETASVKIKRQYKSYQRLGFQGECNQKLRDKTKVRHFLSEFPGKRSPYEFCRSQYKVDKKKNRQKEFCRSFVGKVLFERGLLEFFKCFHIGHQPHQVSNFLLPFGIQIMIESIQLFCLNPFSDRRSDKRRICSFDAAMITDEGSTL